MIIIKTIVFFLALLSTLYLIEDAIEQTIINLRRSPEMFRAEYTQGLTNTISFKILFITTFLWTVFYLFNQF
jgi:hypothetical protein